MFYINSFKITDVVLKQPLEVLRKKGVLKMFTKFIGKYLCCYLFYDKMERLQHSCFHVNFAKYLGASFVRNTSWRPLVMFDFDDYWISHLDYPISFFIPFLTKYRFGNCRNFPSYMINHEVEFFLLHSALIMIRIM